MRAWIAVLLLFIAVGCKKDSSNPSGAPTFDGPWNGNVSESGVIAGTHRIEFTQSADQLDGIYRITASGTLLSSGTISGSFAGADIEFTYTQTHPCAGTFTFDGARNGQRLPYTIVGTTGCYDLTAGTGELIAEKPIRFRG